VAPVPSPATASVKGDTARHITNLRKVGGSVMLAIPSALLDILQLQPGAKSASRFREGVSS
jgi:hypothetical protein